MRCISCISKKFVSLYLFHPSCYWHYSHLFTIPNHRRTCIHTDVATPWNPLRPNFTSPPPPPPGPTGSRPGCGFVCLIVPPGHPVWVSCLDYPTLLRDLQRTPRQGAPGMLCFFLPRFFTYSGKTKCAQSPLDCQGEASCEHGTQDQIYRLNRSQRSI